MFAFLVTFHFFLFSSSALYQLRLFAFRAILQIHNTSAAFKVIFPVVSFVSHN